MSSSPDARAREARSFDVEARGLTKSFGELPVLRGVDFTLEAGERVALIGPSGSGKSTLLRCLNLLERPDGGELSAFGERVDYRQMKAAALSRHRARMGMVFQHFHLFPHRTVLENVMEAPLRVLKQPAALARENAESLLDRVGLSDKASAWPEQLSGGQKQRTAIARALAMSPRVMLLDEVTSALDVEMIAGINELLIGLADDGMTMAMVTHDLAFARKAATRICFLDGGRIEEEGAASALLEMPRSERLRAFLRAVG